jgi:hypothetical protein
MTRNLAEKLIRLKTSHQNHHLFLAAAYFSYESGSALSHHLNTKHHDGKAKQ